MGKHYTPQKYLTGFVDPCSPRVIWQFDKQTGHFSDNPLSIKRVAQRREFYTQEDEEKLTRLVEGPGNAVLDKIRSGNFALSHQDRVALSIYMATMITRVPVNRVRGQSIAPRALAQAATELRELIRVAEESGHIGPELADRHVAQTDAIEAKFVTDLPDNIVKMIESPWPTERMLEAIYEMTWRFAVADGSQYFLTSDNPVFFFECWGLSNDNGKSELTFPISDRVAIFASSTPIRRSSDLIVRVAKFVREANCRLAAGATRFIFCRSKSDWVAKIARKKVENLNRIAW